MSNLEYKHNTKKKKNNAFGSVVIEAPISLLCFTYLALHATGPVFNYFSHAIISNQWLKTVKRLKKELDCCLWHCYFQRRDCLHCIITSYPVCVPDPDLTTSQETELQLRCFVVIILHVNPNIPVSKHLLFSVCMGYTANLPKLILIRVKTSVFSVPVCICVPDSVLVVGSY